MFNNHVRVGKSTDSRHQEKHKYKKKCFFIVYYISGNESCIKDTILSLKKKLNFITYLFYHRRYSLKFRENFSAKAELETAPKQ